MTKKQLIDSLQDVHDDAEVYKRKQKKANW